MNILPNPKEKAEADIKHAVCWGILLSLLSLFLVVISLNEELKAGEPDGFIELLAAVVLFFILAGTTFGIYETRGVCAAPFAVFFLVHIASLTRLAIGGWGNPIAQLAFVLRGISFCYRGIRGTSTRHKLNN